MESSEPRRLASLPGYDTAPDIYETPDLTDDTSTTLQTSPRSPSVSSATSTDEDGSVDQPHSHGVSRRRLFPDRARSRFAATSSRVDARNVDLSDRVDGRRRGYKVQRQNLVDEDSEEEGLEARIARLRREIEECRVQAQDESLDTSERTGDDIDGLGRMWKEVEGMRNSRAKGTHGKTTNLSGKTQETGEDLTDEQALRRVVDFDARLSVLESALGINALDSATIEPTTTPLLPSLILLDQQFSALTTAASLTSLDVASTRIEKLKRQAAELSSSIHSLGPSPNDISRPGSSDSQSPPSQAIFSPEDTKQLHNLYTLLPNLQSLAPTVPAILERLRSLRALHTSAATAAADLEVLEKRQGEMDQDLGSWKQGLEKVEGAIRSASEANGKNGMVVEGWVKDLEGRVKGLSR